MSNWSFITNHGAVLAYIARHGQITTREIAYELGITERSVLRIISELESEGYIERMRDGRSNSYLINHDLPLRCVSLRDVSVSELLKALGGPAEDVEDESEVA